MSRAAVLSGLGAWLPREVVDNHRLSEVLDTSDEWIRTRTGIRARHVVARGEATSDLAVEAGRRALESAGTSRVDAVVLATSTPDRLCPATAPEVASRLGMTGVPAFDVAAVCTGFVYALQVGAGLIATSVSSVLVIGADTFSTILAPDDRTTRAIFGDGAGAVVLRAGDAAEPGALLGFDLGSDGGLSDLIELRAGGSRQRSAGGPAPERDHYFSMQGKPVFLNAVLRMTESSRRLLGELDWQAVDRMVAHQANARILAAVGEQLDLAAEQVVVNLDRVGNTVAGSIPLALADAVADDRLLPGHRTLLTGFGGGLTWGSTALVWPELAVERLPR